MSDPTADALAKLAALQAEQNRLTAELAAQLQPKKPAKRRRRSSHVYSPSREGMSEPTELDRAWARRVLREHRR